MAAWCTWKHTGIDLNLYIAHISWTYVRCHRRSRLSYPQSPKGQIPVGPCLSLKEALREKIPIGNIAHSLYNYLCLEIYENYHLSTNGCLRNSSDNMVYLDSSVKRLYVGKWARCARANFGSHD